MTVTRGELELIEHLDFDENLPCDAKTPCDKPAKWVCRNLCCGVSTLCCDEHKTKWQLWFVSHLESGSGIRCSKCLRRLTLERIVYISIKE